MEPTDPGAINLPTADTHRRRSARIASLVNTQVTDQSREENSQNNTSTQQPKTRPKIILHVNRQNNPNPDQGNLNKDSEDRDVDMADSTNEPPRKIRHGRGDTIARRSRDLAGSAGGSGFDSATGPSAEHFTSLGAAGPAIGHGDRFGYSGSLVAPSPSRQQSTVPGRDTSNQGSRSGQYP